MSMIMSRSAAKFWWKQELPREIAYLYRDYSSDDWLKVTYKEIFAKKKAKQNSNIRYKRRSKTLKPCFIWVFYNDTFLFHGWYLYIKTLKKDYALNFRDNGQYKGLIKKIMNLYPSGVLPFDFYDWAEAFEKTYHHEGFKRIKQGLLKCYCLIDEQGYIEDIYNDQLKRKV